MLNVYNESENIEMDVQVGPEEEVSADMNENPVMNAKKDPQTISVAMTESAEGYSFYVEASDVINYAKLTESSFLQSLNDIIATNEEAGIRADNMVVVMDEGTEKYQAALEANGVTCMNLNEDDEFEMDVQVGPNDDEVKMSEKMSVANPLDVVKKSYDSVVVAKKGDDFFTDVEDVQKCADLKCESVIDTLNGIIAANEDAGMDVTNCVVVLDENVNDDTFAALEDCHVRYVMEAANHDKAVRKVVVKKISKAVSNFMIENNKVNYVSFVKFGSIAGPYKDFINGRSNDVLLSVRCVDDDTKNFEETVKFINGRKAKAIKYINEKLSGTKYAVTGIKFEYRANETDIVARFSVKANEE